MSNYTITTNFGAKDGLASGNPAKLVLGSQFTTEFTNIAAAIASKFDGTVVFTPDGTAAQPSYGFTNNAGTGMFNAAGVLGWATGGAARVTIGTAGSVVVATPTSGVAFQVTGIGGTAFTGQAVSIQGSATASQSNGLFIAAGTNANDLALSVNNATNITSLFKVFGDGGVVAGSGASQGAGTINATAGLFVNGVAVSGGLTTLKTVKTALTARSLNTTPSNDPDLILAIPGAGTYAIQAFISHYNATPSFGISCNLNYSGTYTANSSLVDYATNGVPTAATNLIASAVATSQLNGNTGSGLGTFAPLLITATLVATGAGNVAFSWAQSSSNASATNVGAGSYMTATKIA